MALQTFVKVSSISNLGDARYCAGMGVDLLGFCAIEGQDGFISASHFQQIRGWVTGPHIVAELYGLQDKAEIDSIVENYKPDYLEMGARELSMFSELPVPVILSIEKKADIESLPFTPAFLIAREPIATSIPLLIKVGSRVEAEQVLKDKGVKGIVLHGGSDVNPGLTNPQVINEVLELLETED
jgi:phosphoribosylanthranilate isomerase